MKTKNKKLYIQMFTIHGLVRGKNLELGRDADTGGQVLYVLQLAEELSRNENVERVDVFTRLILDKTVSDDYGRHVEEISEKCRIVRLRCGGRKYIRKELLWPYLDEFIDKTIRFICKEERIPDIIHGHYADAGYVGASLSTFFGVPFVFTGHSLGKGKLERLLLGGMKEEEIEKKFKISHRIQVEEDVLSQADLVITSTRHEMKEQYGQYKNKDMTTYKVIPPGVDLEKFYPYYHEAPMGGEEVEMRAYAHSSLQDELARFLINHERPLILALCRPDRRKNISGLIKAYGEDLELKAIANLAIFAGIRKNITEMEENEQSVLTEMLLLMDKYDLYGKMAIPKTHEFDYEVPELYRICAETRGCFVNPALTEPFGLTLIEAAATGTPIVATDHGGPHDIVSNLNNGILVNPNDTKKISEAIKLVLTDPQKWKKYSKNGLLNVHKYYTWKSHAKTYWNCIHKLNRATVGEDFESKDQPHAVGIRLSRMKRFLITDVDNTLINDEEGNEYLEELIRLLNQKKQTLGFGVATGRTVESAVEHLKKYGVPKPDVIISSVGTEIYYGKKHVFDKGWSSHLSYKWEREKIIEVLKKLDFLTLQEEETQRRFKVSYYMEFEKHRLPEIHRILSQNNCKYSLVYSGNLYLDILPYRASKGKAIRYLSYKWRMPLEHFLVAGDSGNDTDMLKGDPLGIVVKNHEPDLDQLKGMKNIYFANKSYAAGIIEGLEHYGLLKTSDSKKEAHT